MKIYLALMKNDPMINGMPCYRVIECVEIDWNAKGVYEYHVNRWNNLMYYQTGYTIILFHLPTRDVAELAEKREDKEA